ncbi:hypothetical protein ACFE04_028773 [Oxalis oulophora]
MEESKLIDATLKLAKQVITSKEGKNKNIVFSPLSINVALSLMANGYKAGPTQNQILSFLGFKTMDDLNSASSKIVSVLFADGTVPLHGPTPTNDPPAATRGPTIDPDIDAYLRDYTPILSLANGFWVDESLSLKPSFEQVLCNDYKADVKIVDFAKKSSEVLEEANLWAKEKTNGLVQDILPRYSVNELTQFIVANAIYFKGAWEEQFHELGTEDCKFYLQDGTTVMAPLMCNSGSRYIETFDDFTAAKLPYRRGNDLNRKFSMYIFLPNTIDGLPALIEKLTSDSAFLNEHLPRKEVWTTDFRIPKFKFEFGLEATNVFEKMGLDLPFKAGGERITEMSVSPPRDGFSKIYHKGFIEVNEKGTEAAAATYRLSGGGPPPEPLEFVADRPFVFFIREDRTGSILFVGQVLNPVEE